MQKEHEPPQCKSAGNIPVESMNHENPSAANAATKAGIASPQRHRVRRQVGVLFNQKLFTPRPPRLRREFSGRQKICASCEDFQRYEGDDDSLC
jgi:hypothetical protein